MVQWLTANQVVKFVAACSSGKFYILVGDYIDWNVKWFVNNALLAIRMEQFYTVIVGT
jgi:hypothetical protein